MKFAFATAILKIETLRMRRRFARVAVLSRFGRGETRVRRSLIVSITDTYDKIAKFISTRNAMYGMFKL